MYDTGIFCHTDLECQADAITLGEERVHFGGSRKKKREDAKDFFYLCPQKTQNTQNRKREDFKA